MPYNARASENFLCLYVFPSVKWFYKYLAMNEPSPSEATVKKPNRHTTRRKYEGAPTCIELFSGAGGLAEGFRQAGWEILAAADNDQSAVQTFRLNFPGTVVYERDVSNLAPAQLLKETGLSRGALDCLIGAPPCQSFSYNNHARSASKGARLVKRYLHIVELLKPKTLVMENVPGMLTIGDGRVVADIQKKLGKLGYGLGIRILYAEDFGVPQERRRVFFVATRLGWEESLFPNGTHGPAKKPSESANAYIHRWQPSKRKLVRPLITVWEAISDLPRVPNGGGSAVIFGDPAAPFGAAATLGVRDGALAFSLGVAGGGSAVIFLGPATPFGAGAAVDAVGGGTVLGAAGRIAKPRLLSLSTSARIEVVTC